MHIQTPLLCNTVSRWVHSPHGPFVRELMLKGTFMVQFVQSKLCPGIREPRKTPNSCPHVSALLLQDSPLVPQAHYLRWSCAGLPQCERVRGGAVWAAVLLRSHQGRGLPDNSRLLLMRGPSWALVLYSAKTQRGRRLHKHLQRDRGKNEAII